MEPFTVRVLGGVFTVHRILPGPQGSTEALHETIRSLPPERWFVLLDDGVQGAPEDRLAIIDDQFEFQILAAGRFEGE